MLLGRAGRLLTAVRVTGLSPAPLAPKARGTDSRPAIPGSVSWTDVSFGW